MTSDAIRFGMLVQAWKALAWVEYRTHRALALAFMVIGLLIMAAEAWISRFMQTPRGSTGVYVSSTVPFVAGCYALAVCATSLALARENRTAEMLDAFGVGRAGPFLVSFGWSLASSLVLGGTLVLFNVAADIAAGDPPDEVVRQFLRSYGPVWPIPLALLWEMAAWGLLGGSAAASVLTAVGIAAAGFVGSAVFLHDWSYGHLVTTTKLNLFLSHVRVAVIVLALAAWLWGGQPLTVRGKRLFRLGHGGRALGALWWFEFRDAWHLALLPLLIGAVVGFVGLIVSAIRGFVASEPNPLHFFAAGAGMGCGVLAWRGQQSGGHYRWWRDFGMAPTAVWLARGAFWATICVIVVMIGVLSIEAIEPSAGQSLRGGPWSIPGGLQMLIPVAIQAMAGLGAGYLAAAVRGHVVFGIVLATPLVLAQSIWVYFLMQKPVPVSALIWPAPVCWILGSWLAVAGWFAPEGRWWRRLAITALALVPFAWQYGLYCDVRLAGLPRDLGAIPPGISWGAAMAGRPPTQFDSKLAEAEKKLKTAVDEAFGNRSGGPMFDRKAPIFRWYVQQRSRFTGMLEDLVHEALTNEEARGARLSVWTRTFLLWHAMDIWHQGKHEQAVRVAEAVFRMTGRGSPPDSVLPSFAHRTWALRVFFTLLQDTPNVDDRLLAVLQESLWRSRPTVDEVRAHYVAEVQRYAQELARASLQEKGAQLPCDLRRLAILRAIVVRESLAQIDLLRRPRAPLEPSAWRRRLLPQSPSGYRLRPLHLARPIPAVVLDDYEASELLGLCPEVTLNEYVLQVTLEHAAVLALGLRRRYEQTREVPRRLADAILPEGFSPEHPINGGTFAYTPDGIGATAGLVVTPEERIRFRWAVGPGLTTVPAKAPLVWTAGWNPDEHRLYTVLRVEPGKLAWAGPHGRWSYVPPPYSVAAVVPVPVETDGQ